MKLPQQLESLDEVDPELLRTYEKLGISLTEQKRLSGVAVDAVLEARHVEVNPKREPGPSFFAFSLRSLRPLVRYSLSNVIGETCA